MMIRKGFGTKLPWPNLRYYVSIGLEELVKTSKNFSQDSRSAVLDSNPGTAEHETGVLTTRQGGLVGTSNNSYFFGSTSKVGF
jgi:hypothetical protein